ncbi:hypothetical protein GCM10010339_68980 [Streptomyces alanosinicus]|uniref:Uncharacterized protein n=1 Tax=Streptomyces alanosinicus TaxID=68171 RepID=A0A919D7K5_9ACTN|nr:hypothetical protein GCM10010339_68980 [Streptomyces alanosinicus]
MLGPGGGYIAGTAPSGPALRQAPRGDAAGQLWDGLVMVAATDGSFELKRSRDSKSPHRGRLGRKTNNETRAPTCAPRPRGPLRP